jgi:hypothetical protein
MNNIALQQIMWQICVVRCKWWILQRVQTYGRNSCISSTRLYKHKSLNYGRRATTTLPFVVGRRCAYRFLHFLFNLQAHVCRVVHLGSLQIEVVTSSDRSCCWLETCLDKSVRNDDWKIDILGELGFQTTGAEGITQDNPH